MANSNTPKRNLEDFAEIASDWFWETDAAHRFIYFSGPIESVLKISRDQVLGKRRTALAAAQTTDPKWQAHLADLDARKPFRNFEYSFLRPTDGVTLWLRVSGRPIFDDNGDFTGYRGIGHDITHERDTVVRLRETNAALAERNQELTQTRRALERSANQDSLTGLLNRRAFERDLEEALGVPGNDVILLHVDLDRFKWINDTLGHPAGDHVLIKAAERIRNIASGSGPAYRIGGDEFLIVLADNAMLERARWIADALLEAMDTPVQIEHQSAAIGASIGMAFGKGGDISPRQLIANADIALYEAKRSGRGCIRELTPQMLTQLAARRLLASELPGAIEAGEFIPYYQPQIDASTNTVIGAEALARWQHPTHGILAPGAFLDIAAEMGLVAAIDRSIMQQALAFSARAGTQGINLASISINLSAGRLIDPNLVADIDACWQDRDCQLAIELLETISFEEVRHETLISDNLKRLRDMGVRIETDDFGSGRASITSLLKVRPDRLKIDRHLIQAAVSDPIQRNVVSAILDMTRALGIEVVAEGVETHNDVALIRGLGCQKFQGYAYARPMSETDFCTYLQRMTRSDETQTAGPMDLPKLA